MSAVCSEAQRVWAQTEDAQQRNSRVHDQSRHHRHAIQFWSHPINCTLTVIWPQ